MTITKMLTGITPTGIPHLGNYVGAIRPAIEEIHSEKIQSYLFLADYHALIKGCDPKDIHQSALKIAATWLAFNFDTDLVTFYRQSDVPEIMELNWIVSCTITKGLMNRAHAYKAAVQANQDTGEVDSDKGIVMGLFNYPILMAADILMFNANRVPVGRDQIQHLEMTRDIANRMNHRYKTKFVLPEAVVGKKTAILHGLDGRKMSKSYNNTIPLFVPEKKLLQLIRKIKTNSLKPGQPKDPETCTLFQIFSAFATEPVISAKRLQYEEGAGWDDLKKQLFDYLNNILKKPREQYNRLMKDPAFIEAELKKGAVKARDEAVPFLKDIRNKVGIRPFTY